MILQCVAAATTSCRTRHQQHDTFSEMTCIHVDEDALLLDALAFIGDLDFNSDDASAADEELAVARQGENNGTADDQPARGVFTAVADARSSTLQSEHMEPRASWMEAAPEPSDALRKWPGLGRSQGKLTTQNVSRLSRRDEILYLRDLVETLEKRLTSLRPRSKEYESEPRARECKELTSLWAQVATRQYQRRQECQMENFKLRRLLQDHIQVGRRMDRILQTKRAALESLDSSDSDVKRVRRATACSWKANVEFDELLRNCARQYGETAKDLAKFTDDHSVTSLVNHQNVSLVHDPELGLTIQATECRILPFSCEDTVNEIWRFGASSGQAHGTNDYHEFDEEGNSQKIRVHATLDDNRARSKFSGNIARRLYPESHRTLIVMSGLIEPSEITNVKMQGVRLRMSGWIIVEPLDSPAETKFTAYRALAPEVDPTVHDQSRTVDTLTNLLLQTMAVRLDARTQQLENRLFQLAFNRRCESASVSI